MFLDLHAACHYREGQQDRIKDRVATLAQYFPGVWVVAIGGFPITTQFDAPHWCGGPATVERVREEIRAGLGLSAVLTYMNKSGHSLDKLGGICAKRGHDWGYRWMTVSMAFLDFNIDVELAFARDTRFFMSWPVAADLNKPRVFVASATIKDWAKFLANHASPDFDAKTREAMRSAKEHLDMLLLRPEDREQHFLVVDRLHRTVLDKLNLQGRHVFEIGAGHGELTQLILEHDVEKVVAFEIEKDLCRLENPRLTVYEKDVTLPQALAPFKKWALIANPPYELLDFIVAQLDVLQIQDVMLLIPGRSLARFEALGFRVEGNVPGNWFSPHSQGEHYIVVRGFQ